MNIKILTKKELQYFKTKYRFEVKDDSVLVYVNNYNRVTAHNIHNRISISSEVRRVIISVEALDWWVKHFKEKYSPIEVQNAMNFLKISYKSINDEKDIEKTIRQLEQ